MPAATKGTKMMSEPITERYYEIASMIDTRDPRSSDAICDLYRWARAMNAADIEAKRQEELRKTMTGVARRVSERFETGGFRSSPLSGQSVVLIIERMIRQRIVQHHMPADLESLLEARGSMEEAAQDLAEFGGCTFEAAYTALERVYK